MTNLITGKISGFDKLDEVFFQLYYPKQKFKSDVKRPNKLNVGETFETFDDTYTIFATPPNISLASGDKVLAFFWEGAEDKTIIQKLTAVEFNISDDSVIKQNIVMLDYKKAYIVKMNEIASKKIQIEIAKDYDFDKLFDVKENFNNLYKDGSIFFQPASIYSFFNYKDFLKKKFYIYNEDKSLTFITEEDLKKTIGRKKIKIKVELFQFRLEGDLTIEIIEELPKIDFSYSPKDVKIKESVDGDIVFTHTPKEVFKVEVFFENILIKTLVDEDNREMVKPYTPIEIPKSIKVKVTQKNAFPLTKLRVETTFNNGIEITTDEKEFDVLYHNTSPILKISNKEALEDSNLSLRKFNIFLESLSAKDFFVRWSIKIPENKEEIFLFEKDVFSYDEYKEINGIKELNIEIPKMQGKLKCEILLEDSFGDRAGDSVSFDNFSDTFQATNCSPISSKVIF